MASTAEKTVKRIVRTRGALAALITALGVAGFFILTRLLSTVVSFLAYAAMPGQYLDFGSEVGRVLLASTLTVLAFAVGYFFSLWFIAPISERLGLGHVITRSVLAVGIGATVWLIVGSVIALTTTLSFGGGFLGFAFPGLVGLGDVPFALLRTLHDSLQLFLTLLAPGILGGVLLWRWRTAHPPEYHVEGLVDV